MKNNRSKMLLLIICLIMAVPFSACSRTADPGTEQDPGGSITTETPEETTEEIPAEDPAVKDLPEDELLTEDQAAEIVLSRVDGATHDDIISLTSEYDDGRWQYEGSLIYNGIEYEFEIDAQNGNILDWEIDD